MQIRTLTVRHGFDKTPLPAGERLLRTCLLLTLLLLQPVDIHSQEKVLRAGVASMITPVSAVKYYQQAVDYIGKKLDIPVEMVHRTTYDEIDILLENSEIDVAFICSSPYVINSEKFGAELLVAPQVQGEVYYHSNIIVHKESPFKTFEELEGQTFSFVDPKSNSGKLYPTYLLAKINQTPESFFQSYLYSYSHNKSVEFVAKKRTTAAAVDSIVYEFMVATGSPYAEQTKVIHRSPRFGIPPVVIPPDIPFFLKQSLRSVFLKMHLDPEGKKILEQMRIDKFVMATDADYDSIRAMRAFIANNASNAWNLSVVRNNPRSREKTVRFGVLPRDNPIIAYERYQPLMDYLSAATGVNIELHLEKDYKDVVNSLGQGRISFALLGPLTYLDAHKRFGVVPIVRSKTAGGKSHYSSVIATSDENDIKTVKQFEGKRFAFAALWSTSGNLIPRYMLAWAGIHLDSLADYQHFNYHDTVAKKIISGEFDGGALRLSTAQRYELYGLRIMAVSDPIPTGPVVVSPQTASSLVEQVRAALLDMARNEQGRKVLPKLDPDLQGGFISTTNADYFEIRNMINDVPISCGIKCHPPVSF